MFGFQRRWVACSFVLLLVVGLAVRAAFWVKNPAGLDIGDFGGYAAPAFEMSHPFDTGDREPFWCWVLKAWFGLTGAAQQGAFRSAQTLGFLWFPLILYLGMRFAEGFFGAGQAALLGVFLAFSYNQIFHQFLGLREPLECVLALLLLRTLTLEKEPGRIHKAGLAAISAALMLTRSAYLQVLWLVLPAMFRLRRWRVRHALLILCLASLFAIPHFLHNLSLRGNATYFSNLELGKLWGRDFAHRKSYPGNWKEWELWGERDVEPLTLGAYLFEKHRWWQAPWLFAWGFAKYFLWHRILTAHLLYNYAPPWVAAVHVPVVLFYLWGLAAAAKDRRQRTVLPAVFGLLLPYYLVGHIQVNMRYSLCVSPFILLFLAHGVIQAGKWWGRRDSNSHATEGTSS